MHVADSAAPAAARQISIDDEDYPPLLRAIHDPPRQLFVRGDVAALKEPQLAIVGSRRASAAGLRLAHDLAADLSRASLSVCSGLAIGVDGAAHRGALDAGGRSVAVMATGIEAIYPRRHEGLAHAMLGNGCLITEFPPGTPPRRENFPQRNRIVSGLSLGVLVVEAALPSGSLITAQTALEQGREVFALPWSVAHEMGRGCLQLIRDGAKMVQSVEDVLEELGCPHRIEPKPQAFEVIPVEAQYHDLLRLVGYEQVSLEELARVSGRATPDLLSGLSELEIAGKISRTPGGYIRT